MKSLGLVLLVVYLFHGGLWSMNHPHATMAEALFHPWALSILVAIWLFAFARSQGLKQWMSGTRTVEVTEEEWEILRALRRHGK